MNTLKFITLWSQLSKVRSSPPFLQKSFTSLVLKCIKSERRERDAFLPNHLPTYISSIKPPLLLPESAALRRLPYSLNLTLYISSNRNEISISRYMISYKESMEDREVREYVYVCVFSTHGGVLLGLGTWSIILTFWHLLSPDGFIIINSSKFARVMII